jgi:hypothetical protein
MAEPTATLIEGKKFMWDGREYGDREEAEKARQDYEKDGFEARVVSQDDRVRVFTRRVVSHVELTGPAPV